MLKRSSKTRGIQTEVKRKTSFIHFSIPPKFNYFIVLLLLFYISKSFVEIDSNEIICFEYSNEKVLNILDYYSSI